MTPTQIVVPLIVGAYLVGGIPFGLLVGFLRGVDIRTVGSKNIGATNVGRTLGRKFGIAVFFLDVLKGLLPVLLAGYLLIGPNSQAGLTGATGYLCWLAVGAGCVAGHNYPIYLRFRGGKGVATSLGVALGIYPDLTHPALLSFAAWAVVVLVSRYVSLASIVAGISFPIAYCAISLYLRPGTLGDSWPLLGFAVLLAVMVLARHRGNLGRLLAGTEAKIGQKGESPVTPGGS
ncbi:MAG: glycerol-3-phosphate 1-O-acyltransferase PlsY [bacterium]|nr:glycerol-3-phosphate 1-O-acyltransferase PlsY [bacterium]